LEVFDRIRVLARVRDVASPAKSAARADGPDVAFGILPYYVGPWQYLRKAWPLKRALITGIGAKDAVILRVPSHLTMFLLPSFRQTGRPFGIQVVGDPYDVYSPGAIRSVLRPFLRRWFTRQLRAECRRACAAAYITQSALQRRYPCPEFQVQYVDVEASGAAAADSHRVLPPSQTAFKIVTVGSLEQLYKGPDVLIRALRHCVQRGMQLQLTFVGDGKHRTELEALAKRLNIERRIVFAGRLPAGQAVRDQLDAADLFVLPSRAEGLGRAMIEAMARGLPCIGSAVGGIPDLLPPEDLVPPGDDLALANKICDVLANAERMARMSARNLKKAKDYSEDGLYKPRIEFYRYVHDRTEQWLSGR
jgi:glycosyltransferase involved in cell wall biosynthesis